MLLVFWLFGALVSPVACLLINMTVNVAQVLFVNILVLFFLKTLLILMFIAKWPGRFHDICFFGTFGLDRICMNRKIVTLILVIPSSLVVLVFLQ